MYWIADGFEDELELVDVGLAGEDGLVEDQLADSAA